MPAVGDHYIYAKIMLPTGDQKAICHAGAQLFDAKGNVMHRTHANLILCPSLYQVGFARGDVIELTTKSLQNHCTPSVIQMGIVLLIDHHKNDNMISLTDQQTSGWGRLIILKSMAGWRKCC